MLLLKESSFTDDSGATTTFESSSSSPTVLMTSTSSSTKVTILRYTFTLTGLTRSASNLQLQLTRPSAGGDGLLVEEVVAAGKQMVGRQLKTVDHRSLSDRTFHNIDIATRPENELVRGSDVRQPTRGGGWLDDIGVFKISLF
nr:hypothetical protein [Tanacetum cinerariifolium]